MPDLVARDGEQLLVHLGALIWRTRLPVRTDVRAAASQASCLEFIAEIRISVTMVLYVMRTEEAQAITGHFSLCGVAHHALDLSRA